MTLSFRWLGHSGFELNMDGRIALIDPFLTGNPLAPDAAEALSAEVILLTHGHGDHVGDTVSIATRSNAEVIANVEISAWLGRKGVQRTTGMNIGGTYQAEFLAATMTQAIHSSSLPDGAYGGLAGGYLIQAAGKRLYHAGDTALFSDMALYSRPTIDVAFLPIGDHFTMGIEASIEAIRLLRPRFVVPMHFNTFPPIVQNVHEWAETVNRETDAQPIVFDPGHRYTLD